MYQIFNKKETSEFRKKLRKESTPQEIILWSRLRRKALGYKFRRQHAIGGYIVDFFCSEKNLVIEIDGWQHKEAVEYDEERTRYLESLGLKVLRFWNNEINGNLEGVILKVEESLKNNSSASQAQLLPLAGEEAE